MSVSTGNLVLCLTKTSRCLVNYETKLYFDLFQYLARNLSARTVFDEIAAKMFKYSLIVDAQITFMDFP